MEDKLSQLKGYLWVLEKQIIQLQKRVSRLENPKHEHSSEELSDYGF